MKRTMFVLSLACAVFVLCGAGIASAQASSTVVTAHIPKAVSMTLPGTVDITGIVGSQATTDLVIPVKANAAWGMTVYKSADLTKGSDVIASTELLYASTVSGSKGTGVGNTQFALVGTPTNVVTAGLATGEAGCNVTVTYKLTASFNDPNGDYTATHTYTLAAS